MSRAEVMNSRDGRVVVGNRYVQTKEKLERREGSWVKENLTEQEGG